jgi:hypothetical protein
MNPGRSLAAALRGSGGNAIDAPVAALAGLAVAFAAFAVPADLLARLVEATGIAALLPAAEPPLGFDARMYLGAGGAVLAFTLAFALLRGIDRFGGSRPEPIYELEPEAEAPRRRRRDVHPDAPARAPLLAGCELGEPDLDLQPEPEPAPEPEPLVLRHVAAPDVRLPEMPPPSEPEKARAVEAEKPTAEPVPAASPPFGSSIPDLMARLEQGLARRRTAPPPTASAQPTAAAPAEPPSVFPERSDDRLQSAIDSLERLASRQS